MQKVILSLFLVFILFPIYSGYSQEMSDTPSTLSVTLTSESPFVYKDDEGYTIVVGNVEHHFSKICGILLRIRIRSFPNLALCFSFKSFLNKNICYHLNFFEEIIRIIRWFKYYSRN